MPATRFWMPVIGQTVPELVTVALPPPMDCTPAPPSEPITAIEWVADVDSGRMPLFFEQYGALLGALERHGHMRRGGDDGVT